MRNIGDPSQARRVAEAVVEQLGDAAVEELSGQLQPSRHRGDAEQALVERLLEGSLLLIATGSTPRTLDPPKSTQLTDMMVDGPGGEEPTKPKQDPVHVSATLDVLVVSEGGAPLPDVELEIQLPNGESRTVTTAADGRCFIGDLANAGECAMTLTQAVELGSVADETIPETPIDGIYIRRDHSDPILLVTDKAHTVVVLRPRVRVLELADGYFGEARELLLFAAKHHNMHDRFEERVTARAVFRRLIDTAGDSLLLVAGHTDTVGGDADN
ncbi:MAG: hypothetical protein JKY37_09250 [Nannocystaceae bacterium]|nr:hypothetical protein [Nannocystaceae bacterium]